MEQIKDDDLLGMILHDGPNLHPFYSIYSFFRSNQATSSQPIFAASVLISYSLSN
jgi:hypothetical protein